MQNRKAYIWNLITAGAVMLSVLWMFSGIKFGNGAGPLTASKWEMLKFYTIDSNILMGIVAAVMAKQQSDVLRGRKESITPGFYVLKLVGVVGVTLTMTVTVCFLAPTSEFGWLSLFSNSNFFLHLLNPLLSIYTFLRYERTDSIAWKHTFTGITTMLIYATVYLVNCLMHISGGNIPGRYDWYGFFVMGVKSIAVVLPIIIAATYLISLILWCLNRRKVK